VEYVRVRDEFGRTIRYAVLDDDYWRVGFVERERELAPGQEKRRWRAIDNNGQVLGDRLGDRFFELRPDAAEALMQLRA
jgi:hypothetical protein